MLIRAIFSSLILMITIEKFSSNDPFMSLENSTSHLSQGKEHLLATSQGKFFEMCNIIKEILIMVH